MLHNPSALTLLKCGSMAASIGVLVYLDLIFRQPTHGAAVCSQQFNRLKPNGLHGQVYDAGIVNVSIHRELGHVATILICSGLSAA